jgi:hypothetical protein
MLGGSSLFTGTWVGLTDLITEETFLWVTDEVTDGFPANGEPPWDTNSPENNTNTNCVIQVDDGILRDVSCTTSRPYLCECDGYPVDTTHF